MNGMNMDDFRLYRTFLGNLHEAVSYENKPLVEAIIARFEADEVIAQAVKPSSFMSSPGSHISSALGLQGLKARLGGNVVINKKEKSIGKPAVPQPTQPSISGKDKQTDSTKYHIVDEYSFNTDAELANLRDAMKPYLDTIFNETGNLSTKNAKYFTKSGGKGPLKLKVVFRANQAKLSVAAAFDETRNIPLVKSHIYVTATHDSSKPVINKTAEIKADMRIPDDFRQALQQARHYF